MRKFSMDAHMHFDLYKDRDKVVRFIEESQSYTIAMTNLPVLFEKYMKNYCGYKYIKLALGFHPELAYEYQQQLSVFLKNIGQTRYIGEIGLDFTKNNCENQHCQMKIFKAIVEECSKFDDKILSIHSRKAAKEVIDILENYTGKVILHWYTGNLKEMQIAISRGYYFSINHQMIRSVKGEKIINLAPLDKILIESDAPFTYGLNDHYDLNFLDNVYAYLSNKNNVSIETIQKKVENNFKALLS